MTIVWGIEKDSSDFNSCPGVDIFHVALPNFKGSEKTYHMLALKEDYEIQQCPPDAALPSGPEVLLRDRIQRMKRRTSERGVSCRSSSRASSKASAQHPVLHSFPDLASMVLLLDPTSPQHDIHQVHLQYAKRRKEQPRPPGFPSLRRLVRPTESRSTFGRRLLLVASGFLFLKREPSKRLSCRL